MTEIEALQSVLAAEHAAVYVYGVLGGQTSQSAQPALLAAVSSAYTAHRGRRDLLSREIADDGADPVAAAAAYELSGPLLRTAQVQAEAVATEESSVEVLLALVAQSVGSVREWALAEATWSATWQLQLGGEPQTWPGAPELA